MIILAASAKHANEPVSGRREGVPRNLISNSFFNRHVGSNSFCADDLAN